MGYEDSGTSVILHGGRDPATTDREKQVYEQLAILGTLVERIDNWSVRIEDSLGSVLREEKSVAETKEHVREDLVPLADQIRIICLSLDVIEKRLVSIKDRLEV